MRIGSLFSGIGGFDLAARWMGWETAWYSEIDPFCNAVMAHHFPEAKALGDITQIDWSQVERPDLLCGGFPCQDISSAGAKVGIGGARSGLWSEFARAIRDLRPGVVVVENVADLLVRGIGDVLRTLAGLGYDAEWAVLPAAAVGLPQRRFRTWIVAHPHGGRGARDAERDGHRTDPQRWAHPDGLAVAQRRARTAASRIRRMDDGLPNGTHRLRALGNSLSPLAAYEIFRTLVR